MTKRQVIGLMGDPGNRQFLENIEVWQYCSLNPNPTMLLSLGTIAYTNYKAITFKDSKVEGISTYSRESYCHYDTIKPKAMIQHSQTNQKQQQQNTRQKNMEEAIRQERIKQQILNHGAGGCTPNFSTGGCL